MGKVLKSFTNGFAGAIGRALDDVVVALANRSAGALAYGVPVALNGDKNGVVPFDGSTHTAADFVGVTVRDPSKTPDTYGSDTGSYAVGEIADVLVRGHIVVKLSGASLGAPVSINKTTGAFSTSTGDSVVALTNAHVSAGTDSNGMAEILLNTRNVI